MVDNQEDNMSMKQTIQMVGRLAFLSNIQTSIWPIVDGIGRENPVEGMNALDLAYEATICFAASLSYFKKSDIAVKMFTSDLEIRKQTIKAHSDQLDQLRSDECVSLIRQTIDGYVEEMMKPVEAAPVTSEKQ